MHWKKNLFFPIQDIIDLYFHFLPVTIPSLGDDVNAPEKEK